MTSNSEFFLFNLILLEFHFSLHMSWKFSLCLFVQAHRGLEWEARVQPGHAVSLSQGYVTETNTSHPHPHIHAILSFQFTKPACLKALQADWQLASGFEPRPMLMIFLN